MSDKKGSSNCENCAYYEYDDYYDSYGCSINLDEDEMERFMSYSTFNCPYFKFYDEYKMIRKQN